MRLNNERIEAMRTDGPRNTNSGAFLGKCGSARLSIIASDGGGWDHVSVSLATRCPTWEEMCWVKRLFFEPDEVVMQLHPAETDYVNNHKFCLHLWRPQSQTEIEAIRESWGEPWPYGDLQSPGEIPTPETWMVGIKQLGVL